MGGVPPWGGGRVGHGPLRTILWPVPRRQARPVPPESTPSARPTPRIGSAPQDLVPP